MIAFTLLLSLCAGLLSAADREARAPCRVGAVQRLDVAFPALAPRFSPDGERILFSGIKYAGVWVHELASGANVLLADDNGYGAIWSGFPWDSEVVVRGRNGELAAVGLDGTRQPLGMEAGRNETAAAGNGCTYFQADDRIFSRCGDTVAVLSDSADRDYNPKLSPDGTRLVFEGLASGISVADLATGAVQRIGPGNHPSWFGDSGRIVYDVSRDDGLRIVASELWLHDLESGESRPLTETPERHEMSPSPSPDGRWVAFEASLSLYVGQLECGHSR